METFWSSKYIMSSFFSLPLPFLPQGHSQLNGDTLGFSRQGHACIKGGTGQGGTSLESTSPPTKKPPLPLHLPLQLPPWLSYACFPSGPHGWGIGGSMQWQHARPCKGMSPTPCSQGQNSSPTSSVLKARTGSQGQNSPPGRGLLK